MVDTGIYVPPPRVIGYTVYTLGFGLNAEQVPALMWVGDHLFQPTNPKEAADYLQRNGTYILDWTVEYYYPEYQQTGVTVRSEQRKFMHGENQARIQKIKDVFNDDPYIGAKLFKTWRSLETELLALGWEFGYRAAQLGQHKDPATLVSEPVIPPSLAEAVSWHTNEHGRPVDTDLLPPTQEPPVVPEPLSAPGVGVNVQAVVSEVTQALLPTIAEVVKAIVDERLSNHNSPETGAGTGPQD